MGTTPPTDESSQYDVWSYRLLVGSLGATVLSVVGIAGILAGIGRPIPEGLYVIGAAAGGALATKLTRNGGARG